MRLKAMCDMTLTAEEDCPTVAMLRPSSGVAQWLASEAYYFDPPVHRQQSHANAVDRPLPITDRVASEVVCLPLYRSLTPADVDRVVTVIGEVHAHASVLGAAGAGAGAV